MSNTYYWLYKEKDDIELTLGFFRYIVDAQFIQLNHPESKIKVVYQKNTWEWRAI